MMQRHGSSVPPAKQRRLDQAPAGEAAATNIASTSLNRSVSPPVSRRKRPVPTASLLQSHKPTLDFDDVPKQTFTPPLSQPPPRLKVDNFSTAHQLDHRVDSREKAELEVQYVASPFQLTRIRDLAAHQNVDAIQLKDILGNPLIKECWNFNFLFDLDFVLQQFDEDIRQIVKVKIIHGFWKRDDERRIDLMEVAERYSNVELISAYLPDPFGTHHSKMLILFRHDDCAQIIIHTANMIPKDWTNMTQAVWQSPLLPLRSDAASTKTAHAIGTGHRFHLDLRHYLLRYERRLQRLVDQLALYSFSNVRAAFLGSAPSRQVFNKADAAAQTSLGWLGLRKILNCVPTRPLEPSKRQGHVVLQVSSIATLGAAPTWLSHFQIVLSRCRSPQTTKPHFNVIFPTAEEVRTSLDGYASGGSIHTKIQSTQQQKQLQYLRPLLCHWKHLLSPATLPSADIREETEPTKEAHRGPAAPHIKTYIRFGDESHSCIDWALLTSANLSKQAWGDVVNKQGEVRIQSYETGVLVWPELFANSDMGCEVSMVPVFGKDMPGPEDTPVELLQYGQRSTVAQRDKDDDKDEDEDEETEDEDPGSIHDEDETEDETEDEGEQTRPVTTKPSELTDKEKTPLPVPKKKRIVVGLRMPYNLPLSSYSAIEVPWCATQQYPTPDWKGCTWGGY